MKTIIKIPFLCCFWIFFSQAHAIEAAPAKLSQISSSVVCLRMEKQAYEYREGQVVEVWHRKPGSTQYFPKKNYTGGTGFTVIHNDRTYIVTAAHVAKNLKPIAKVLYDVGNDLFEEISFKEIIMRSPKSKWFYHKKVDMAVHPLMVASNKQVRSAIHSTVFIPNDRKLAPFTSAYALGFPMLLGVSNELTPIAKQAQIAADTNSINMDKFRPDIKYILIDQPFAKGYSGSPVFVEKKPAKDFWVIPPPTDPVVKLIGITSATLQDSSGGKIGVVVPISYLDDIFNSSDFISYEKSLSSSN